MHIIVVWWLAEKLLQYGMTRRFTKLIALLFDNCPRSSQIYWSLIATYKESTSATGKFFLMWSLHDKLIVWLRHSSCVATNYHTVYVYMDLCAILSINVYLMRVPKDISYEGRLQSLWIYFQMLLVGQSCRVISILQGYPGWPHMSLLRFLISNCLTPRRGCPLSVNSIIFILEGPNRLYKLKLGNFLPMDYVNLLIFTLALVPRGGSITLYYCFIYVLSVMVSLASS